MKISRLTATVLSACLLLGVAAPSAHSRPGPARIDRWAHRPSVKQNVLERRISKAGGKAFGAKQAKLYVDGATAAGQRKLAKLDNTIAKAEAKQTRLLAKQTRLRGKAAQTLVKRNAGREAFAQKLTTRSTTRLLVEQWIARNVLAYFTPDSPMVIGATIAAVVLSLTVSDPIFEKVFTGLAVLTPASYLMGNLIPDKNGDIGQPGDRNIPHQRETAAPYHALELLKRGYNTPKNIRAVEAHEAGLEGEIAALARGNIKI